MKTHITILAAAVALLAAASCSSPLPVEGTWETDALDHEAIAQEEMLEELGDLEFGAYYTFTPSGKKSGSVITGMKGKFFADEEGSLDFSMSVPGTYSIKDDMIIISNDLNAIESDFVPNPVTPLDEEELESDDYKILLDLLEEKEKELKSGLTPPVRDTLKQVVINDNTMTVVLDDITLVYKKVN